jgi:hypothetical protein
MAREKQSSLPLRSAPVHPVIKPPRGLMGRSRNAASCRIMFMLKIHHVIVN